MKHRNKHKTKNVFDFFEKRNRILARRHMKLEPIEKQAIQGLSAREIILRKEVENYEKDRKEVFSVIEKRLGLPDNSIGVTHIVENEEVLEAPKPSAPNEQADLAGRQIAEEKQARKGRKAKEATTTSEPQAN